MQQEQRILFKNDAGDYVAVAAGEESVLQAGLRQSVPLNYHCASGSCGSCKARLIQGALKVHTGTDFIQVSHAADQVCEYPEVHLCQSHAVSDCVFEALYDKNVPPDLVTPKHYAASLSDVRPLGSGLYRLLVDFDDSIRFLPGQYVMLATEAGDGRAHILSQILRRIPASWNLFFHATRMERCRRSSVLSTISACNCKAMGHWAKPTSVPVKIKKLSC